MWDKIADYVLKHRVLNLVVVAILLIFLGLRAFNVKMGHNIANTLPENDSIMVVYRNFLEKYGQDGCSIFIGMQDDKLFELARFQDYYDLNEEIRNIEGVNECLSVTRIYDLKKNDSIKKFTLEQVVKSKPQTQDEVDAIRDEIMSLAMYDGLLFNTEKHFIMMLVSIDKDHIASKLRTKMVNEIKTIVNQYGKAHNIDIHISGMPYIREVTTQKMIHEIVGFSFLAIFVAGLMLFLFFRSWRILVSVIAIVLISVIYMFGIMVLLDFDVTILTGVLPPLLIIIGVENSIFMLNKYHREFNNCHDKFKALHAVIMRIGPANLLTNTTTAVSFASFIITKNVLLVPFGILASVCIMLTYVLTMVLLPTFFSYQKAPSDKNINYLDNGNVSRIMVKISALVMNRRRVVYAVLCPDYAVYCMVGEAQC